MKKKYTALMLTVAIAPSLLAGCQSSKDKAASSDSTVTSPSASATASVQGYDGKNNLKVSDTPVTISLFYPFGANGAPKGDMPVWQEAAKITNVTMKNIANASITDDRQSFNTMLSSGDLPDIIQGFRTNINPVISQGVFLPLDDLINQYAPNIKKFLADYPDAKRAGLGADGKMYTITGTLGGEPGKVLPSMGYFLRQDWLDKLGLKVPKTQDEYKKVLYAFRQQDPNGNGKQDEIPFFYRNKGIGPLLQLWDAKEGWYIGKDDKVHHGKAEPEYRTALKELSQWYKDGIIDPEIFTRGSQARQFLLGNNLGGATIDWFSSTAAVNDTAKAQVPAINFVAIAPPADVTGKVKFNQTREPIHGYAWGISAKTKDPVTVIRYMDFFFSEKGERLVDFGLEGTHYKLENNVPVPLPAALTNPGGYPNFLRSIGAGYEIGSRGSLVGELSGMNDIGKKGFTMYQDSDWLVKPFPVLSFTEAEKKTIDSAMANMTPFIDEYEQKGLMAAQAIDATWDKHLEEMNKLNLQIVLDAYNSAYARFKLEAK
ncbi:extracellular solute-binding protein [Paenibacillus plantarum]|nr:extracellular solute-binding protein [Paenibacillus plantarum]